MVGTSQDSHEIAFKQLPGRAGSDLTDGIRVDPGHDDPHLIDPACAHRPGQRIGPVTGLLDRLSDTLSLFFADGAAVYIPAYSRGGYPRELRNFFNCHFLLSSLALFSCLSWSFLQMSFSPQERLSLRHVSLPSLQEGFLRRPAPPPLPSGLWSSWSAF